LTGSAPHLISDSLAGLSHSWKVKTVYYEAEIPIWIDEIRDAEAWKQEFLKPEAKEVLEVLGAVVVCFRKPVNGEALERVKATLGAVSEVVRKGCGYGWDGVCLAVSMPQSVTPHLLLSFEDGEDNCRDRGFEYIDAEAKGRNEYFARGSMTAKWRKLITVFGAESVGIARIREALEANDWARVEDDGFQSDDLGLGSDEEEDGRQGLGAEAAEIEREMFGMKQAIYGEGQYERGEGVEDEEEEGLKVEQLEGLILKMQVVKGKTAAKLKELANLKFD
ncbi:MAG: hypothetical protein M1830_007696, partial [Pleopsidium flavum]